MLTDKQLEEIRERADKATPGPWKTHRAQQHQGNKWWINSQSVRDYPEAQPNGRFIAQVGSGSSGRKEFVEMDSVFISNARQDIPLLLDTIEELKKEKEYYKVDSEYIRKDWKNNFQQGLKQGLNKSAEILESEGFDDLANMIRNLIKGEL